VEAGQRVQAGAVPPPGHRAPRHPEHAVPLDVLMGWLSETDISSTGSLCKEIYIMNAQPSGLLPVVALEQAKSRI